MALTWAQKRRRYIIGGAVLVGIALLASVAFAIIYDAPSCMDGKQNQDESGIDCGGSCSYLCRAEVTFPNVTNPPAFARAVANAGRTDVIAYVENRNQDADVKAAPYTVEVFDATGALLGASAGTVDLPARSIVPIFIPGIVRGLGVSPQAFVTFNENLRFRVAQEEVSPLSVKSASLTTGAAPKVLAVIENRLSEPTFNRTVIATIFDSNDIAVAASRTIVKEVPASGTAEAVFTWNEPFMDAARVEVRVVPVLP